MINELFIQSPTRKIYELNQQDIHEDSLVFIEDTKEIIAKNKSYKTIPDGGAEGLVLVKKEDGAEWGNIPFGGTVDSELSYTSTNPVLNKVITNALANPEFKELRFVDYFGNIAGHVNVANSYDNDDATTGSIQFVTDYTTTHNGVPETSYNKGFRFKVKNQDHLTDFKITPDNVYIDFEGGSSFNFSGHGTTEFKNTGGSYIQLKNANIVLRALHGITLDCDFNIDIFNYLNGGVGTYISNNMSEFKNRYAAYKNEFGNLFYIESYNSDAKLNIENHEIIAKVSSNTQLAIQDNKQRINFVGGDFRFVFKEKNSDGSYKEDGTDKELMLSKLLTLDDTYVRKSGDMMTGPLNINSSISASVLAVNSINLDTTGIIFNVNNITKGRIAYENGKGFYLNIPTIGHKITLTEKGTIETNTNIVINIGSTIPPIVSSSTVICPSLNADMVDGLHSTDIFRKFTSTPNANFDSFGDNNNNNGIYYLNTSTPNASTGLNYGGVLNLSADAFSAQFAMSNDGVNLKYRTRWWSANNGTWKSWKTIAFTDSTVAAATKLATTRTLWGRSFDGSGNVSGDLYNVSGISFGDANAGKMVMYASSLDGWSDGKNTHPWYGYDARFHNTGVYSTTISNYFGMTLKTGYGNISITQNGKIGVNTETPTEALDVNGNVKVSGDITTNSSIVVTDGNILFNGEDKYIKFKYGSTIYEDSEYDELTISTSTLLVKDKVTGDYAQVIASGFSQGSDIRYKNNIEDIELSVNDIASLPSIKYTYGKFNKVQIGTSAQDCQKILPEAVTEDSNGRLSLDYSGVTMVAVINMAKEVVLLKEQIKELTSKIA